MNNKLGVFLAGGLIGAGVALFYAPRTGVETRAMVADKAQAMWGQAQGLGAQVAVDAQQFYGNAAQNAQQVYGAAAANAQAAYTNVAASAQQAYTNVAQGAQQAYVAASDRGKQAADAIAQGAQAVAGRAHEAAEGVKPVFAEKNDELRAKNRRRPRAHCRPGGEKRRASIRERWAGRRGASGGGRC